MSFLNAMSMSRRLWLLTGASLVGLVIMATSMLLEEANIIRSERQRAVQQTVEVAHTLIAHNHELVTKGTITEAELARISSIIRLACGAEIISFGNHEASTLPLISGANTITAELWSNPRKGELERVAGASVAEARRKLWEAGWSLLA